MNDLTMNGQHVSVVGIAGGWASSRNESSFGDNPSTQSSDGRHDWPGRDGDFWQEFLIVSGAVASCSVFFPQLFWVLNPLFLIIIVYHLWFWLSVWEELGTFDLELGFEETFDLHCTFSSFCIYLMSMDGGRILRSVIIYMTRLPKFS